MSNKKRNNINKKHNKGNNILDSLSYLKKQMTNRNILESCVENPMIGLETKMMLGMIIIGIVSIIWLYALACIICNIV